MSDLSLPQAQSPRRENTPLNLQVGAPDQRDVRVTAILIRELAATRREFTTAVQRIRQRAQQLSVFFNEPQVTEAMVVLALLLDPDGLKEVQKYKIDTQAAYRACMATLNTFRAATPPTSNNTPPFSDKVKRLFESAKTRARKREDDISLIAVEDLFHAILTLPREGSRRRVLTAFQPAEARTLRTLTALVRSSPRIPKPQLEAASDSRWTVLGVVFLCFAGASAVGFLFSKGLLAWDWNALVNWLA